LHLTKETLPLGAFPRGGLLLFTESELLATDESCPHLRSQGNCRA
jgi:hypothetical protein